MATLAISFWLACSTSIGLVVAIVVHDRGASWAGSVLSGATVGVAAMTVIPFVIYRMWKCFRNRLR